jgi:hypothetical protein
VTGPDQSRSVLHHLGKALALYTPAGDAQADLVSAERDR